MSVKTSVFIRASINKGDLCAWKQPYSIEVLLPGPVDRIILALLLLLLQPGRLSGCSNPMGEGSFKSKMEEMKSRRESVKLDKDLWCLMGSDRSTEGEQGSIGRFGMTWGDLAMQDMELYRCLWQTVEDQLRWNECLQGCS